MKKIILMVLSLILAINILSTSLGVTAFAAITNAEKYSYSNSCTNHDTYKSNRFIKNDTAFINENNDENTKKLEKMNNQNNNENTTKQYERTAKDLLNKNAGSVQNYLQTIAGSSKNTQESKPNIPNRIEAYTTDGQIILVWKPISNASEYEIEVDGNIVNCDSNTMYFHENLEAGTVHKYRVRAKNSTGTSEWSDYVSKEAVNKNIEAPENIKTSATTNTVVISWSEVQNATGYDIEVDNVIQDNDMRLQFIHKGIEAGSVHTYIVRAKNGETLGKWSQLYVVDTLKKEKSNQTEKSDNVVKNEISNSAVATTTPTVENTKNVSVDGVSSKSITNNTDIVNKGQAEQEVICSNVVINKSFNSAVATATPTVQNTNTVESNVSLNKTNDQTVQVQDLTISQDYTLQQDLVCNNLYLTEGTLNLNGYKLTVLGNLVQSGGSLAIRGGNAIVNGDYTITGNSLLNMTNTKDYVLINGNFTMSSNYSSYNCLTAGVLEVKGNVSERTGASGEKANFYQTYMFKLVLSGAKDQIMDIQNLESSFNYIDSSKSVGVIFKTQVSLKNLDRIENVKGQLRVDKSIISLDKDLVISYELVLMNTQISLNAHQLEIKGDLKQELGQINVGSGKLIVDGNYTLTKDGVLYMVQIGGYVLVNGNLEVSNNSYKNASSGYNNLYYGTLEVKGNITERTGASGEKANFYQTYMFKLVLSGAKDQIMDIQNLESLFNYIDSSKSVGVIFKTQVSLKNLDQIENVKGQLRVDKSIISLDKDLVINYELVLMNTQISLNAHQLEIKGDFKQELGQINVGSGKLIVDGNYTLTKDGILCMAQSGGYVLVNGNLEVSNNSYKNASSGYNNLYYGTLEVKGNLTERTGASGEKANFYQTYMFKLVLSGAKDQIMDIQNLESSFNYIDSSKSVGVIFKTQVSLKNLDQIENVKGQLRVDKSIISLDKDLVINYELVLMNTQISLNAHKLEIKGNLIQELGQINVGSGKLIVDGNYTLTKDGALYMTQSGGYVLVNGNLEVSNNSYKNTSSGYNNFYYGTLEVKGNITERTGVNGQKSNFLQTYMFKLVLSGAKDQIMDIQNLESSFINIDSSKSAGVIFKTPVALKNLNQIGNVKGQLRVDKSIISLDKDLVINYDLVLMNTQISLNAHRLEIKGNLIQELGQINVGSGKLIVDGNYTLTKDGVLYMAQSGGYVLVNGNLEVSNNTSKNSSSGYNNFYYGTLEVKGNITERTGVNGQKLNFLQTYMFKLILSGAKDQIIDIQNWESSFVNIDSSKSAGVIFKTPVALKNLNQLENVKGQLRVYKSSISLDKDLVINYQLVLMYTQIDLSSHQLEIKGDFRQELGQINIGNGKLIVDGNYTLTKDGILYMAQSGGYVLVNGNLEVSNNYNKNLSSGYSNFYCGTLEVKGNLTERTGVNGQKLNFKQEKGFTVKLTGDKLCIVSIENVFDSEFYKIDSTGKRGGVKFVTKIRLRSLSGLENVVDGVELYYSYLDFTESVVANYNLTLSSCTMKLNDYSLIIHGNLTYNEGVDDLCGSYLYVSGDINQHAHSTKINGACLIIDGNYTIDGLSHLDMTNKDDYVYVGKDFKIATQMSESGLLTNGVLEIRGNFTQKGDRESFHASGNHTVKLSGKGVQTVVFESPNQSGFENLDIDDCAGLIWDHEEIDPLTVTGSFLLGLKDAVVDTVGSIAGIFSNLSGTLKSAVYLCTIFSCPLFENEREKLILSLYNQMGDWMEKEIFYGNANDRARATGDILGSVIMAVFGGEEFEAITKSLKAVSESKALLNLADSLKGFTKLNKYEDVIGNATLKEKIAEVIRGGRDKVITSTVSKKLAQATSKLKTAIKKSADSISSVIIKVYSRTNGVVDAEFAGYGRLTFDETKVLEDADQICKDRYTKWIEGKLAGVAEAAKRQTVRILDMVVDSNIVNRVEGIRSLLPSDLKKGGNVALAEVEIPGVKSEFYAHNQIDILSDARSAVERVTDISLKPTNAIFTATSEVTADGRTVLRDIDSEYKILNDIANQLGDNVNVTGRIELFTELECCPSCKNVIIQFLEKYRNITIEVINNQGTRLIP